jgi:flavin-dependent dehydrogenase
VPRGLPGYSWIFPCLIDGRPHANVGVYSAHALGSGALLRTVLQRQLRALGAPRVAVKSFPIRCFGHGRVTGPNVLLVGDAAGVEALMGEGISFAFDYGRWAAAATARALATGQLDFAAAERELRASWMGKKLRRLELASRLFYGRHWRVWFALARASRTAQHIGVRWYNGVDGWDRRSGWRALGAWLIGRPQRPPAQPPLPRAP